MSNNPAAELRVPRKCKPGREVRPLSAEEVHQYLGVLDLPARLMARLAIYEGVRPGEILALRWGSLEHDLARVSERVYWGPFDAPKNGKSREVVLSSGTLADLRLWRRVSRSTDAEAFVFASENPASPLSMRNFWPRAFKTRLEKMGSPGRRSRCCVKQMRACQRKLVSNRRCPLISAGMALESAWRCTRSPTTSRNGKL